MVSTRGIRYKFSEGERVLCYEPDPTKAKVLYDSKVLEVIESKDKRGRRTVEYLIHFQGWNSSWDRCVSEDFVLKDTEENRQLQRDLAEKSQLQLGAYLYRRERKKGSNSNITSGPAKRARHGFSDDGSSSSTQPEDGEMEDTDSSSGSASSNQPHSPLPNTHMGRAHIPLSSALRDRLTFDYHLVVKRGRLSRLPATPSAAQILESFVKWFARAGAWHPARARHDPPQRPDMLDVSCRLNLVREVADGLRVYFDFILGGHLLYRQEQQQYYEVCAQFNNDYNIKSEPEEYEDQWQDESGIMSGEEDIKSPKMEYSHISADPGDDENGEVTDDSSSKPLDGLDDINLAEYPINNNIGTRNNHEDEARSDSNEKTRRDSFSEDCPDHSGSSAKSRDRRWSMRRANIARRLRSYKSPVSQSENEDPGPSTSAAEQRAFETFQTSSSVGSSGSSLSEGWVRPARPPPTATTPNRTPLSQLLDKVAKWEIIPRDSTDHLPSRVYGAIHLARLFVRLPDFLNATQMPDYKLKLILKHIDMFIQYLDEHSEWFGEMYYIADGVSRSH